MTKKSFPELSIESKLLYERLKKLDIGESVSYQELTKLIGRDTQSEGRGNLNTARDRLKYDDQVHFGVVCGVGLKRINHETVVNSDRAIKHITKMGKRRKKELGSVNYDELNKDAQHKHNVELTQIGTMIFFARGTTAKQISEKLEKAGIVGELPVGKTLEFFART